MVYATLLPWNQGITTTTQLRPAMRLLREATDIQANECYGELTTLAPVLALLWMERAYYSSLSSLTRFVHVLVSKTRKGWREITYPARDPFLRLRFSHRVGMFPKVHSHIPSMRSSAVKCRIVLWFDR